LSRRNKRRTAQSPTPGAGGSDLPDPDVLSMIIRTLNGELDGPDLVALHAATRRRIEELLTAQRPSLGHRYPPT
jgi:hypothetical protein